MTTLAAHYQVSIGFNRSEKVKTNSAGSKKNADQDVFTDVCFDETSSLNLVCRQFIYKLIFCKQAMFPAIGLYWEIFSCSCHKFLTPLLGDV